MGRDNHRGVTWPIVAVSILVMAASFIFVAPSGAASGESYIAHPQDLVRVNGSNTMYVLDSVGCPKVTCLQLYRTNVNATNFTRVNVPPIKPYRTLSTGNFERMFFPNVQDGFALVGEYDPETLYATTNGAKTWHKVSIGSGVSILGLSATKSSLIAVTAHCSRLGRSCHDYQVSRSSLLATKWSGTTMPRGKTINGYPEFDPNVAVYGSRLWLSEQPPGNGVIYFSSNRGASFHELASSKLISVAGCALTATSSTTLWAECPTGMMVAFAHSRDAGKTWRPVPQQQFSGTGGGQFDPVTNDVAYLAYGATQPFVRITEAGLKATKIGTLTCSKVNSSINHLLFTDVDHGLAVCLPGDDSTTAQLLRTDDGGVSWTRVPAN
jgi:hypothetical protein